MANRGDFVQSQGTGHHGIVTDVTDTHVTILFVTPEGTEEITWRRENVENFSGWMQYATIMHVVTPPETES